MEQKQIRPGLWQLTARDEGLRVFRAASFTETGMMYQSYLMDAGGIFIALGTLPARYGAEWLETIRTIVGDNGIGWAVLLGTEDDRAAARLLMGAYSEAVFIGGNKTLFQLEGFTEQELQSIEARTNRSLTLGNKRLELRVLADKLGARLYVLDRAEGVLVTADAFGSVYGGGGALVSELADKAGWLRGAAGYFADIQGPKRRGSLAVAAALVRENGVGLILPALGPAVDADIDALLSVYEGPAPEKAKTPTVAVVYTPGGYVRELAEQISGGIGESGAVAAECIDLSAASRDKALKTLPQADAYLFGTPEVGGDAAKAVWDIVTSLTREDCAGKLAAVFCSTDSKGRATENLRQRLGQLGSDLNLQDYTVQVRPDGQALKNAYEYGYGISCSVLKIPNPRKPKLVKCLVCGEIFDASLGVCPVCGVGLEQCVPVDEEEAAFRKDTDRRYVILGGGIAGLSAAEAIRARDGTGGITMVSAESCLPINRPMLTKDLQTVFQALESLSIHPQDWYKEQNIELRLGCEVVSIDTVKKQVLTAGGEILPYDKLICATGAECFVPPFEGHDKPGVLTIRHLTDSAELAARMKGAKNAVVIGGGVLGLEAASELMRAGIKVTVLEAAPQIIGRQVDVQSAALLRRAMEKLGVLP